MTPSTKRDGDSDLAEKALAQAAGDDESLREELEKLSPEEAERFVTALSMIMKRRRLLLVGYMLALLVIIAGMAAALYVWGTAERGTFIGWVFMLPLATAGAILMIFGRLAKAGRK